MTSEKDEEESEAGKICRKPQINKRIPDNNDNNAKENKT